MRWRARILVVCELGASLASASCHRTGAGESPGDGAPASTTAENRSSNASTALGKVTIDVVTPCTRVFLVQNGTDRRELPSALHTVDLDPHVQWSLEATRPHHRTYAQPISFEDGLEKKYVVRLEPETDFDPRRDACPAPAPLPPPEHPLPPVEACLTLDQVHAVLAPHQRELRPCWSMARPDATGATSRHVALLLTVGPDGVVADAQALGDAPATARCVEARAAKWRFPAAGCTQKLWFNLGEQEQQR